MEPIDLRKLQKGTKFKVLNETWQGKIIESNGQKALLITYATNEKKIIPLVDEYILTILLVDNSAFKKMKWPVIFIVPIILLAVTYVIWLLPPSERDFYGHELVGTWQSTSHVVDGEPVILIFNPNGFGEKTRYTMLGNRTQDSMRWWEVTGRNVTSPLVDIDFDYRGYNFSRARRYHYHINGNELILENLGRTVTYKFIKLNAS